MPITEQTEQNVRRLTEALKELGVSAYTGAAQYRDLLNVFDRLTRTDIGRFAKIKTTFKDFEVTLRAMANAANYSEEQIRELLSVADQLGRSGRLGFRGGLKRPEFSSYLSTEKLTTQQRDIRKLSNALKELGVSAETGYFPLIDLFKRLHSEGISRFAPVKDTFEGVAKLIKTMGTAAGYSQEQIEFLINTMARLGQQGRIRFRGGKEGIPYVDPDFDLPPTPPPVMVDYNEPVQALTVGQRLQQDPGAFSNILGQNSARAIATVNEQLRQMGMSLRHVHDVQSDASRGIVRWSARMEQGEGVTKRAVITTDRFGGALKSSQRHLRTFAGSIARDIREVFKWSIAIAIVYAPLRRLTELSQEAVEVQSKLADVQISLAGTSIGLEKVWSTSTEVARQLGVSVGGVVDGYVLAARATSDIVNPTERAQVTTALLRDSMILARLAGIEQAQALDTLVGALRQLNIPLDQGGELLDKWVAVSRNANVSLETLAESFAITATAAENAGLDIDRLNGIIAAVAEATTLSATESGNAVRALISGFQSDRAEKELTKLGVAVRNTSGEFRSFVDIFDDITQIRDLGLMTPQEMSRLANAIGGGYRRGAQFNAVFNSSARIMEIAAVSADASGDAMEALAIKTETLQTTLTNLDNAFTELARTLGNEGGFLDLAADGIKTLTLFVDVLDAIVEVLGSATPSLVAFTTALLALRTTRAQAFLDSSLLQTFGKRGIGGGVNRALLGTFGRGAITTPIGQGLGSFFGAGGGAVGGAAIGLGASILGGGLGIGDAIKGDAAQLSKSGATIAGAILGTLATGGSPVGGIIGSSIAQAITSGLIDEEASIYGAFYRAISSALNDAMDDEVPDQDDLNRELFNILGRMNVGAFAAARNDTLEPTTEQIEDALLEAAQYAAGRSELEAGPELLARLIFGQAGGRYSLPPEQQARIAEILDAVQKEVEDRVTSENIAEEGTPFGSVVQGIFRQFRGVGTQRIGVERQDILQQVARGQAGPRVLADFAASIELFETQAAQAYGAIDTLIGNTLEYVDVVEVLINSSVQEKAQFTQLVSEIDDLYNEYQRLIDAGEGMITVQNTRNKLTAKQIQLEELLSATLAGISYREYELPSILGVSPEATRQQLQEAVEEARVLSENMLDTLDLDDAERQKVIDGWGELALQNVETYGIVMQEIEGVNQDALNKILEQNKLAAKEVSQIPIQLPDITSTQFQQALPRLPFYNQLVSSIRPLDEEKLGFIFRDNVTDVIHADQLAIQLLLRDIKELNEDQLEGIFNIPDGVVAAIPFTGQLFFSTSPIGEGGGFAGLVPPINDVRDSVDTQTGILHQDLQELKALRLEEFLTGGTPSTDAVKEQNLLLQKRIEDVAADPFEALLGRDEILRRYTEREPIDNQTLAEANYAKKLADAADLQRQRETYDVESIQSLADKLIVSPLNESMRIAPFGRGNDTFDSSFGGGGISTEEIGNLLPDSIPVTANIDIEITNPVYIDSSKIQEALSERLYSEFKDAKRRTGTLGYVVEV